jgi:hypothetical protein
MTKKSEKQKLEELLREYREVQNKVDMDKIREHIEQIDPYFWQGADDSLDLKAVDAHLNGNNHEDSL